MTRGILSSLTIVVLTFGIVSVSEATEVTDAALPAYCAYERQSLEITRESQRRFADIAKADEWAEAEVRKLNKPLEEETGVSFYALLTHAIANKWKLKCNAMNAGKPMLDGTAVAAATRTDASRAKDLLESYYLFRLNSDEYPLFEKGRFSAIRCTWDTVTSIRFVGCQPISFSERGSMGVYAVGQSPDGSVLIAPINGKAMTHIEGMPHIKQGAQQVAVASYTGSQIDIPAVLQELK